MCGIAGLLSSEPIDLTALGAMLSLLRHRGPDDEGLVAFTRAGAAALAGDDTHASALTRTVAYAPRAHHAQWAAQGEQTRFALGHRRLSIIDLSPLGHQPMSWRDRCWIVYNGEVFNYLEMRADLERDGYVFTSQSDTEVLLAGYDRWGTGLLDRCNGMWAFALYDLRERTLLLARDRFGVKPLYYRVSGDGRRLSFASEIKAFTALPDWSPRVSGQHAFDFLAWGIQDHTDGTMFDGVFQLPPGHLVQLRLDETHGLMAPLPSRLPAVRWYELASKRVQVPDTFEAAAARYRELFLDAVRLRMRADVPLGSCLSGGLDSSSIVCAVRAELDAIGSTVPQPTFSSCSEILEVDEREFIREVSGTPGIDSRLIFPDGAELMRRVDDLVRIQDEPFGSSSIFAQWSVFRAARDAGVTVMLDGQGADEQLAGYHGFLGARLAGLLAGGRLSEFGVELAAARALHGYGATKVVEYLVANLVPGLIRPLGAARGMTQMRRDWIDVKRLGARDVDPFVALGARATSVRGLSLAQMGGSNLQMLLHWEDRNSMASSIEARVPFLDYRLVEYTLSLPDNFKLSRGITKRALRNGMQGLVPPKILERIDKKGFLTAEEHWMKGAQRADFAARVDQAIDACGGVLTPRMRDVFTAVADGRAPFSFHVWRAVSFGAWVSTFNIRI
jgi:asparagine synthase (glutamine-hydrolysing)